MKFHSTGGKVRDVSLEEAIFTGFASDGGVLMPDTIPKLSRDELLEMRHMSYVEVVKRVASKFISTTDVPPDDLNDLIDDAFTGFSDCEEIAPLHQLTPGLSVLELWHGPTLAFKDYGLACLARLVNFFQKRRKRQAIAVIATSGDTGSAALEAFKNQSFVDIIVLLPKGWCTKCQELQMMTVGGRNTHVIRVDGNSDELDVPMKAALLDQELSKDVRLFSVNSINFGRILFQIAHHIFAFLQTSKTLDGDVEIVIPSGALGNITSGCLAQAMGVPMKFVLCTNSNDIAHRMLLTRNLEVVGSVSRSYASAMNIQNPYNVQRLFWLFSEDKMSAAQLAATFEEEGSVTLPKNIHEKMQKVIVDSCCVSNERVLEVMVECHRRYGYLVCPHTACALSYCLDHEGDNVRRVVVATASPAKFQEVADIAGLDCPLGKQLLTRLERKTPKFEDWTREENWTELVKSKIRHIITNP